MIFKMDTFLLIEYIKAAIGVVLDIKFEEIEQKLVENQTYPNSELDDRDRDRDNKNNRNRDL